MLLELPKTRTPSLCRTAQGELTPEEIARFCVDKIVEVSDKAPPEIRDQAHAFKAHLHKVITHYVKEGIKSDRTTVYNMIKDAGYEKLAEQIRRA